MIDKPEIRVSKEPWSFGVGILIRSGNSIVKPIDMVFSPHEDHMITNPSISIDSNAAQQLIDDLWQCGYRPSEGSGSAGSLRATEKHLKDMRDIAFGLMSDNRRQS